MPDRQTIRQTLIDLVEADTGEKHANLDDNVNLREGLGLDSVDVVSIVSQIERQFRIRLTHQELETLVTVGDVLNLLEVKLAAAESAPGTDDKPAPDSNAA
jgi:acyl carrier protein